MCDLCAVVLLSSILALVRTLQSRKQARAARPVLPAAPPSTTLATAATGAAVDDEARGLVSAQASTAAAGVPGEAATATAAAIGGGVSGGGEGGSEEPQTAASTAAPTIRGVGAGLRPVLYRTAVGAITGFGSAVTGTSGPVVSMPMLLLLRWPIHMSLGSAQVN
jgi:hypothetical protein